MMVKFKPIRLAFVFGFGGATWATDIVAQVAPPPRVAVLEIEEVWNADGKEIADGLSVVVGLVEGEDGRIWILDTWPVQGRVLVLDPETLNAEIVGGTGDGPGEVRFPTGITITRDRRIAVYDMSRRAVEIYEASGKPFRRVQLRTVAAGFAGTKGFVALASGGYLISAFSNLEPSAIHYFDEDGRWLRGWKERYPPKDAFPATEWTLAVMMAQQSGTGGWLDALPDGSFLYSEKVRLNIVRFEASISGSDWTERPVVSMPELFDPPGAAIVERTDDGGLGFGDRYPHTLGLYVLNNGHILSIVDFEGEQGWLWQVFDPKGSADADGTEAVLVAEASLDREYIPRFVCENGDLLATVKNPVTDIYHILRLRLSHG